jgi:hypothetical protein
MKIRRLLCALALVLMQVSAVPAQSQEQTENPLDQLAWMVGGKWVAEGDKGPDGKPFHAEWSCRWGANHRTLEFTVWFLTDGKLMPVYEGMYAWHPGKKKLIFVYSNNEGALTEGEAVMNGDRLEQDFHIAQIDGTVQPFRSTIVRQGADDYDWNVQRQKDGVWTVMFALKYRRTKS